MSNLRSLVLFWKTFVIILTPLFLLPLVLQVKTPEAKCGYAVLVVAIYWMAEVVPLAVTSLLPLVLLPALGLLSTDNVSMNYMKESNMMCMGGLTAAIAVEYCNLHKRIALRVLLLVGTSPRWLMLGFMMTTMFLSMWVSNTATTAMMVPIVEAVLTELFAEKENLDRDLEEQDQGVSLLLDVPGSGSAYNADAESYTGDGNYIELKMMSGKKQEYTPIPMQIPNGIVAIPNGNVVNHMNDKSPVEPEPRLGKRLCQEKNKLKTGILLAVCYAANLGGTGTLTGTNPNLVLKENLDELYGPETGLNYATWMLFSVPAMLICGLFAWLWLQFLFIGFRCPNKKANESAVRKLIQHKYAELGPMTFHEMEVLGLFIALVFLWVFREPGFIRGWASLFPDVAIKDSSAAMLVVFILFVIPKKFEWERLFRPSANRIPIRPSEAALDWKHVQEKMPWGVLLLMGAGFALADASKVSGLSRWLGSQLTYFSVMPPFAIVAVVSLITMAITQVASNTATATILVPVLADMAEGLHVHPLYLMLPAVSSCSYAFMLPIATPPNAVVFESTQMTNADMIKPGLIMNLICLAVMMFNINTVGMSLFGLDTFPKWALLADPNYVATVNTTMVLNSTMVP